MSAVLFAAVYGYIIGIGAALFFDLGDPWVPIGYGGGGSVALAALAALWFLRKRGATPRGVVLAVLFAAAGLLGIARQIDRSRIPPFDPARPGEAYHLRALMEAFPDTEIFRSKTRIVARIIAEPEYFPPREPGQLGAVNLLIAPESFEPDPVPPPRDIEAATTASGISAPGRTYRVSGGAILLRLSPTYFLKEGEEDPWRDFYMQLVRPEAYGGRIRIALTVQKPTPAANPGAYDQDAFLSDKDIYGSALVAYWDQSFPPIEEIDLTQKGFFFTELAIDVKQALLREIKRTVPFPESAFLAGVTLGARTGLAGVRCLFEGEGPGPESTDPDVRNAILDEFRWSGTSHVLAVSGLHVSIIAIALYGFFAALRIPPRIFAPLIILCLFIFTLLVGAPPSTMRAAIMNSIVLLVIIFGRQNFSTSVIISLTVAAGVILWDNPKWLLQPSFALSFMALYSLGLLTEPTERILAGNIPGYTRLPGWLRAFVSAQFAIQFGMMFPLSSYYFTRMSTAGPFCNFLAIPLSGLIIPLGLIASGIGTIPIPGAEWVAMVLNAANFVGIKIFLYSAHLSTVLAPFPFVKAFSPRNLVAYFGAVFGLYAFSPYWVPRLRIDLYDARHGIIRGVERARILAGWAVAAAACLAVVVWSFWPPPGDDRLRIRFLSVGYGDAIHIATPGGRNLLIDAGGAEPGGWDMGERAVAAYFLKQQIGSLEGLIVTSPSLEKMAGVGRVLQILPTRRFYAPFDPTGLPALADDPGTAEKAVLAELGLKTAGPAGPNEDLRRTVFFFDRLRQTFLGGDAKTRVLRTAEHLLTAPLATLRLPATPERWRIRAGDVLVEEAGPGGTFRITALTPPPAEPGEGGIDRRVAALRIEYGKTSLILPSDLTRRGLEELLTLDPALLDADAILVPAQGSQICHSPLFLQGLDVAHREATGEDTPPRGARLAILSYGYSRELRGPSGGGGGRTQRSQDRPSIFPHRLRFTRSLEREADATSAAWREAGWRVLPIEELGSILLASDGETFHWGSQLPIADAAAEAEEEAAGQHVLREYN